MLTPIMITVKIAEEQRAKRKMDEYQFSIFLGFSPMAYREAVRRGSFSKWMAERISQRCGVKLDGKR